MKVKQAIFLASVLMLLSLSLYAAKSENSVSLTLQAIKDASANYPEKDPDLSVLSKAAVVLGQPDLAIKVYTDSYNSEYGRNHFGAESLYQIFLVHIDKHNAVRDIEKARAAFNKMQQEWPEAEQTKKANKILSQEKNEGKNH